MASGAPVVPPTPKKTPATPRKRKPEADQEGSAKKPRTPASKNVLTLTSGEDDDEMSFEIKSESKEEQIDEDDDEIGDIC